MSKEKLYSANGLVALSILEMASDLGLEAEEFDKELRLLWLRVYDAASDVEAYCGEGARNEL